MGVKGLWKLLQPSSRLIKLDCLEGTKLSVDLSIWLHQAIHARVVAAISGSDEPRVHLQLLFHRLLKLLFYGIRAIFVFDGPEVSSLKKRTQLLRRLRVNQATLKCRRTHAKLVKHIATVHFSKAEEGRQLLSSSNSTSNDSCMPKDVSANSYSLLEVADGADDDKSDSQLSPKRSPSPTLWDNLAAFDLPSCSSIDPQCMAALPSELQFQLYASKKSASCSLEDLPEDSADFSTAQMKRLVNRSELSEKMSRLRNEIILSDPVIALSLSVGQADSNLVRLRKMLSRDQKHHVLLEDEATAQVKEENEQKLNVQSNSHTGRQQHELESSLHATTDEPDASITVGADLVEEEDLLVSVRKEHDGDDVDRSTKVSNSSSASLEVLDAESSSRNTLSTICIPSEDIRSSERTPTEHDHNSSVVLSSPSTDDSDDFIEVEEPTEPINRPLLLSSQPLARSPSLESIGSSSSSSKDASPDGDHEDNIDLLRKERMHAEAAEKNVTSQILEECEELIRSFGMPVVKGPAEAEAQCAWLEENNITEGTITDDSDIWLFGGRRVYRHLFNVKKTVERFDMNTITNIYGLDRERLVLLAMLVGCDYTVGVEGIGAVRATEIIAEFDPTKEDQTSDRLECLRLFRAWCERIINGNNHGDTDEPVTRERFAKLAHCQFPGSFPDPLIFDAFLRPRVDQVDDRTLSWNLPDVDKIRNLTSSWFGWSKEQTDRHLLPVVKRAAALQSKRQKRLDDFCTTVAPTLSNSQVAPLSQRVKRATSRLKATVHNRKRRQSSQAPDTSSKLAGWCPSEADKPKRSRLT
ncbi:hypothetical protein M514_09205 [Trichuris suis]|uniref:Uncharacterized protein n=1 Tax=Trichuris suis TaxID=68888 RepID=A0A085NLA1_9BILA|nr:hypothetical protein M514_09205 [Trichuris suis]KHJ40895.1 XPG I-region [Trichuris suis]